jgi:hypothetical protein
MRIRILVTLGRQNVELLLYVGNRIGHKTYQSRCKSLFERLEISLFLLILFNCLASGSGSAFQIRIRIQESQINADPDPHYC